MPSASGQSIVYSDVDGDSPTWRFNALTPWISTAGVKNARATMTLEANSGACEISPAYQTVDDIEEDTPETGDIAANQTLDESSSAPISYPAAWTDLTDNGSDPDPERKQFIRFGVKCSRSSGTVRQYGRASIDVEYKAE